MRLVELVFEAVLIAEKEGSTELAENDIDLLPKRFGVREKVTQTSFALPVVADTQGKEGQGLVRKPDIFLRLALTCGLKIRLEFGFFVGVRGCELVNKGLVNRPAEGLTKITIEGKHREFADGGHEGVLVIGRAVRGIALAELGNRD
jgi:hypothetical protein